MRSMPSQSSRSCRRARANPCLRTASAAAEIRWELGESDGGRWAEEIVWGFRKLLEERGPLAVVFDDVQWGEETFLDLVEQVALLSGGAPLLLVSMARPELLDIRPSWP